MTAPISVILPAKNEADALRHILPKLTQEWPEAEIIVVDDGSIDDTRQVCLDAEVTCLTSPYSMGNGAAIKRGARHASSEVLVFMDADGQHDPSLIAPLLAKLDEGYQMVVGSRNRSGQASAFRSLANGMYNRLATWVVGQNVMDLTSGFRVVKAKEFREFLYLLPNGFSYPTTITMAFFRNAYPVAYEPISVRARQNTSSHIRPFKDGVRFLLIIFKVATLYSPLKLFFPTSSFFFLVGMGYYANTYFRYGQFTNMSALLFSAAVIIFLVGLVSEQITALMYKRET